MLGKLLMQVRGELQEEKKDKKGKVRGELQEAKKEKKVKVIDLEAKTRTPKRKSEHLDQPPKKKTKHKN